MARSFTVVTGHTINKADTFANWEHLVHADTLVVLMGMRKLPQIAETLIKYGRDADTPVGVIEKATYQSQKTVVGTLGTIAEKVESLSPPGTIVIGELAAKSNKLAWFKPAEDTKTFKVERRTQFAG